MTATTPDVSILIVAYNSQAIISACLGSIPAACTRHTYEVLLIDNGDGTSVDVVAAAFPSVKIVPSHGNVGFAAGNNLLAAQASGRHLLLLNPDVVLKPDAVDRLLEATKTYPHASAWGGVTLDQNDRPDLGNTVQIPSLKEMLSRTLGRSSAALRNNANVAADAEVKVMSGSFVMFSRTAWDEAGGLDERYFLYCEEVDLFYRLAQRGHSFWRISAAQAFHNIGHGEALSGTRMLYRAAGNMQFARLHWPRTHQLLAFLLTWLGALQRLIIGRLAGRIAPQLRMVGDSHRDIAMRPHYWHHGYDPQRGLLAQLKR
ncbi:MAG: glycosyltransferase family 2 protein [Erythrobacter sp.]|nr:glycosyltransferase family 2 protein [Erythrobacter sp.]